MVSTSARSGRTSRVPHDHRAFQGEVDSHLVGTYSQLLVSPKGRTPIVNVSLQGTPFPPIPVATGSLGVLLRPVLWLYRWLVRLATGK